jgi:hypothetical protein
MEGIRENGVALPASTMPTTSTIPPGGSTIPTGSTIPPGGSTIPPVVQAGGDLAPLSPASYAAGPGGFEKSQYYTISGGSRRRKGKGKGKRGSKRKHRKYKGGEAVLATAAVPFGLLALQRYFKGSKTSKRDVAKMGRSFKRTFRRRF